MFNIIKMLKKRKKYLLIKIINFFKYKKIILLMLIKINMVLSLIIHGNIK
jgi:hypothetical protein